MRKLAVLTFLTLDGVMQGPNNPQEDPSNGFEQGGWAKPYWDEVMAHVRQEVMAEPYDMLLGRKTYEIFSAAHIEGGSENIPIKKKYVATSTFSGDLAVEVRKLKQQEGPLLQIHGSGQLIQELLRHQLIDELRLWTFPVIVGAGKRLFSQSTGSSTFHLERSAPAGFSGVIMSIYRRAALAGNQQKLHR